MIIEGSVSELHYYKKDRYGNCRKYCFIKRQFFNYYQANESESQGGVDRCDKCGEVVRY